MNRRAAQAVALGEGYGVHDDVLPKPDQTMREHAQGSGFDLDEITNEETNRPDDPSFAVAIAPIILVIVANLLFVQIVVPRMDTSYLALPMFGETDIETLRGVWSIIVALSLAILLLLVTNWRRLGDVKRSLNHGADASVLPIFNTASLVGFGAVIAALPVFELITNAMLSLSDGNPLVSVAVSVGALSALTGSASGGMSIALDVMIDTFLPMAALSGTSLEVMHRVTSLASGALDCMPHNGAVITVLAICKLTHKDSYFDILIVGAVIPFIALVAIIIIATMFGSF